MDRPVEEEDDSHSHSLNAEKKQNEVTNVGETTQATGASLGECHQLSRLCPYNPYLHQRLDHTVVSCRFLLYFTTSDTSVKTYTKPWESVQMV